MSTIRIFQIVALAVIALGRPQGVQAAEEVGSSCKDGLDHCLSTNGGVFYSLPFAYCPVLSEFTCETCCPSSGDTCSHAGHQLPGYDSQWGECN